MAPSLLMHAASHSPHGPQPLLRLRLNCSVSPHSACLPSYVAQSAAARPSSAVPGLPEPRLSGPMPAVTLLFSICEKDCTNG
jgi:hypothetical protein